MKYNGLITCLSALLMSFIFLGCKKDRLEGSGPIVSEERGLNNFYNVNLLGNSELFITAGNEYKMTVKGYENLLPMLKTTVANGVLTIQFDKSVDISNDKTQIYITMPSLVSVRSEGNSKVHISGSFVGMDILTIEKTGSGDVDVSNTAATNLKLTLSGNSNFNGFGLSCENAIVRVNGNGDAELTVTKNLNATINGNGNVYYKGNPQVVTQINGNGQVIRK